MVDTMWLVVLSGLVVGFGIGAVSAFIVGQRFMRFESRRLYERWRRREKNRHQAWTRRLVHDIKNPIFLIQAFTWTYLDKFKRQEFSSQQSKLSSEKMAETLNRQATRILGLLKTASHEEEPALPAPAAELWKRIQSKEHLHDKLSHCSIKTMIPADVMIQRDWTKVEEGLEDLLSMLLEDEKNREIEVSLKKEGSDSRWKIFFPSNPPSTQLFNEARNVLELWADKIALWPAKNSPRAITFSLKA